MQAFIARQPILDLNQKIYGYELLFRSGLDNFFHHPDPDQASSKVLADSFFLMGIQLLTGGRRAFINVTREILLNEYLFLIPKDLIVVEILENVTPDDEVISACRELKQAGYLLALDDFRWEESWEPLVKLADFIKIDFLSTEQEVRESLVRRFTRPGGSFSGREGGDPGDLSRGPGGRLSVLSGILFQQTEDHLGKRHFRIQAPLLPHAPGDPPS